MMKLIPHAHSVADLWPTAKDNAAARPKGANAKNMVLKYVAPFVQANHIVPIKPSYHP